MVPHVRPAGQAKSPATVPTASAPTNGRVAGIDGVLDQIAAAVMRQAQPLVKDTVLPAIKNDPELQKNLGQGIGRGLGQQISAPIWIVAGALGILAVVAVVHAARAPRGRQRPSSRRNSRRSS